jgi:hypothetical protein
LTGGECGTTRSVSASGEAAAKHKIGGAPPNRTGAESTARENQIAARKGRVLTDNDAGVACDSVALVVQGEVAALNV